MLRQNPEGFTMATIAPDLARIASLNDRCRQGLDPTARIVITRNCLVTVAQDVAPARLKASGCNEVLAQACIMAELRKWKAPEDSPERDLGWFYVGKHKLMFKFDYYDLDMEYGSEDPADATKTVRVLTIMLPSDY